MKVHKVSMTALFLRLEARTRDADMPFLCKPSLGFGTIVTVTVSTQHFPQYLPMNGCWHFLVKLRTIYHSLLHFKHFLDSSFIFVKDFNQEILIQDTPPL